MVARVVLRGGVLNTIPMFMGFLSLISFAMRLLALIMANLACSHRWGSNPLQLILKLKPIFGVVISWLMNFVGFSAVRTRPDWVAIVLESGRMKAGLCDCDE